MKEETVIVKTDEYEKMAGNVYHTITNCRLIDKLGNTRSVDRKIAEFFWLEHCKNCQRLEHFAELEENKIEIACLSIAENSVLMLIHGAKVRMQANTYYDDRTGVHAIPQELRENG